MCEWWSHHTLDSPMDAMVMGRVRYDRSQNVTMAGFNGTGSAVLTAVVQAWKGFYRWTLTNFMVQNREVVNYMV